MVDHMDYGELGRIEVKFIPGTEVGRFSRCETFMIKDGGADMGTLSFWLEFQLKEEDFRSMVLPNAWAGRVRRGQPSSGSPGILPGSGPPRSPGRPAQAAAPHAAQGSPHFPNIPDEAEEQQFQHGN